MKRTRQQTQQQMEQEAAHRALNAQLEVMQAELARKQTEIDEKDLTIAERDRTILALENDKVALEKDKQVLWEELLLVLEDAIEKLWDVAEEVLNLTEDVQEFQALMKKNRNMNTRQRTTRSEWEELYGGRSLFSCKEDVSKMITDARTALVEATKAWKKTKAYLDNVENFFQMNLLANILGKK